MQKFSDIINDEQVLDIALFNLSQVDPSVVEHISACRYSMDILVTYIVRTYGLVDPKEVSKKVDEMVIDYNIKLLADSGLVDVDFSTGEPTYELSDKGKELLTAKNLK